MDLSALVDFSKTQKAWHLCLGANAVFLGLTLLGGVSLTMLAVALAAGLGVGVWKGYLVKSYFIGPVELAYYVQGGIGAFAILGGLLPAVVGNLMWCAAAITYVAIVSSSAMHDAD